MVPFTSALRTALAAIWFAAFALVSVSILFHELKMASSAVVLYVVLPTVAGAIAGALWGKSILDQSKTSSIPKSLLRGILVALGAFVIFAVLFGLTLPLVERGWSYREVGGLMWLAATLGFLLAAPLVLIGGMVAGLTLHLFARRIFGIQNTASST